MMITLVREECLAGDFAADPLVAKILHHADDLHVGDVARLSADPHVTPNRAVIAEVQLRHLLIDDDHAGNGKRNPWMPDGSAVALVEIAAFQQGDSQGCEIATG